VQDNWIPDSDVPTTAILVSEDEVECAFLGLDVNKGPGPDGIAPAILKRLVSVVKVPVVFNLSLLVFFLPFQRSLFISLSLFLSLYFSLLFFFLSPSLFLSLKFSKILKKLQK
jgi:hypothetical protein